MTIKKYSKGFVFGKFMPPHAGHIYMIEEALKAVDKLYILVCSLKSEPIEGKLRFEWMKNIFPQAHVIHITDENPSYPDEHPDFWNIWIKTLSDNLPKDIEIIFSSETYGEEIALRMNIIHQMIDQERLRFPVSGTDIRTAPFAHWQSIPKTVRPFFLKRIVLTGPESTGKTVLAEKLANYFHTSWVKEYGREYVEKYGLQLKYEDISKIATGHLLSEEKEAWNADKILICDTDLIVTQVWSEIYFKDCEDWIKKVNTEKKYDLFLLLDIDVPWIDDGTREFPNLREWHFNRLKEELEIRGFNFIVISGSYEERYMKAIAEIEKIMVQ